MVIDVGSLKERGLPTPFGAIHLPSFEFPKRGRPYIDERRRKAVKHAMATDLTRVFDVIPYVGGLIGGQVADLHGAEIYKILTPEEMHKFVEADKRIPLNSLALLYSFVR